jgi:hypothetical protein
MEKHVKDRLKTKSKIEKEVETVKPTVINDDLIESYMVSYNKENKIFDRPDMRIWDLTHLALSYKSKSDAPPNFGNLRRHRRNRQLERPREPDKAAARQQHHR